MGVAMNVFDYRIQEIKNEIAKKDERIRELEDIICPGGKHDWQKNNNGILTREINFDAGTDFDVTHYRCSRCRKQKRILRCEE